MPGALLWSCCATPPAHLASVVMDAVPSRPAPCCACCVLRWEGITYDPKRNQLYTAMSGIRYGMENNNAKGKSNTK